MESDREPLIPEAPRPSLPALPRAVVGKWFWIGLGAFVGAMLLAFTPARHWGPDGLHYGGERAMLNMLAGHRILVWTYLIPRGLLGYPSVWGATIVLLWIAFARPQSPDRVLFAAAATSSVVVFGDILNRSAIAASMGPVVSTPIAISFVGCASMALAAGGLRQAPRAVVQALCALAFAMELSGQELGIAIVSPVFLTHGLRPITAVCALLFGAAILALGIEFAEQCGAGLFNFARRDGEMPRLTLPRLRSVDVVALGAFGILCTIVVGSGFYSGWIDLPVHAELWVDNVTRTGWPWLAFFISDILGDSTVWLGIAVAFMWYGFAKTTSARRALFAAGVIAGTIYFGPAISGIFDAASSHGHSSLFGFPTWNIVLATAGCSALLVFVRAAYPHGRTPLEWLCVAALALAVVLRLVVGSSPIYVASGLLLGTSFLALGISIARHAGIDPFRSDDREIEAA